MKVQKYQQNYSINRDQLNAKNRKAKVYTPVTNTYNRMFVDLYYHCNNI